MRIEALSVPRALTANSSAGDVRVEVPDAVYAVQADTSAGDRTVDVRQDPASPRRIVARCERRRRGRQAGTLSGSGASTTRSRAAGLGQVERLVGAAQELLGRLARAAHGDALRSR